MGRRRLCLVMFLPCLGTGMPPTPNSEEPAAPTGVHGAAPAPQLPDGFAERTAKVNGVTLNYKVGGKGSVVILLHGYAQTSDMWRPLLPILAPSHMVIAPDLRGIGRSERTATGYDKKTMAQDIHALVSQLNLMPPVALVGHDIGLMVAYAYAAQFPDEVSRVALLDAFLPGIGDWKSVWLMKDLWHFHFYGETALALVKGRERTYLEHFWNDFAADRTKSVPEADRKNYAEAYARDDGMRAGFEVFRNFERDAEDFAVLAATKLKMPVLVQTGEKASGTVLIDQTRLVAQDVRGVVVKGAGHWLLEEAPEQVIPELVGFLTATHEAPAMRRLTPTEIAALPAADPGAGTSGVASIRMWKLMGDPSQHGLYTIRLEVPANTRIEAHEHPDDRAVTVVSGTWFIGSGSKFDETALKELGAGSFYTEPPHLLHFARTGGTPAVVHITGFGPTGTRYADLGAPPKSKP